MKKNFRKYSILGVPLGLLGFLLDSGWLQYLIFIAGGAICALGWILEMEVQGQRTLANKGIENEAELQAWKARAFPEGSGLKKFIYKLAIFGAVVGLLGFFFENYRIRYSLFALFGACCFVVWILERKGK